MIFSIESENIKKIYLEYSWVSALSHSNCMVAFLTKLILKNKDLSDIYNEKM